MNATCRRILIRSPKIAFGHTVTDVVVRISAGDLISGQALHLAYSLRSVLVIPHADVIRPILPPQITRLARNLAPLASFGTMVPLATVDIYFGERFTSPIGRRTSRIRQKCFLDVRGHGWPLRNERILAQTGSVACCPVNARSIVLRYGCCGVGGSRLARCSYSGLASPRRLATARSWRTTARRS